MKSKILFSIITVAFLLFSCKDKAKNKKVVYDTTSSGTINISVDESFRPIIEEQLKVFHSSYPDAKIITRYKPEADCINDLHNDEDTRMVIITRELTKEEIKSYEESGLFVPKYRPLAKDGVAVIVNKSCPDSLLTIENLHDLLSDKGFKDYEPVFDGIGATSNYRFAQDSILKGKPITAKNVKGAKGSAEVIEYVHKNPKAIGFIGISWIGDYKNHAQDIYRKNVAIASIRCEKLCEDPKNPVFVKPSQSTLASRSYPLTRILWAIVKENEGGLGSGFTNFMHLERGQLIFRRAYLMPVNMPFIIRQVKIEN